MDPNDPNTIYTGLLGTYNIGGNYNDFSVYGTTNGRTSWTRKGPEGHVLCLTANPLNIGTTFLGTFS